MHGSTNNWGSNTATTIVHSNATNNGSSVSPYNPFDIANNNKNIVDEVSYNTKSIAINTANIDTISKELIGFDEEMNILDEKIEANKNETLTNSDGIVKNYDHIQKVDNQITTILDKVVKTNKSVIDNHVNIELNATSW